MCKYSQLSFRIRTLRNEGKCYLPKKKNKYIWLDILVTASYHWFFNYRSTFHQEWYKIFLCAYSFSQFPQSLLLRNEMTVWSHFDPVNISGQVIWPQFFISIIQTFLTQFSHILIAIANSPMAKWTTHSQWVSPFAFLWSSPVRISLT